MRNRAVYIGFDARERDAFEVACSSIQRRLSQSIPIHAVVLGDLIARGLYTRPTERRDGRIYDLLSARPGYDGACSTEFAVSRFLVKHLAREGLALFADCDVLARTDLVEVFEHCERVDPGKALYCVQHHHRPRDSVKMDGQAQAHYGRKNWSSVYVIDTQHVANRALTLDLVNTAPGAFLHGFRWLADCDIGALDPAWNWLAGYSDPRIDPKLVHFTSGGPWFRGFEHVPYADEWRASASDLAQGALSLPA